MLHEKIHGCIYKITYENKDLSRQQCESKCLDSSILPVSPIVAVLGNTGTVFAETSCFFAADPAGADDLHAMPEFYR